MIFDSDCCKKAGVNYVLFDTLKLEKDMKKKNTKNRVYDNFIKILSDW